MNLEKPVAQIVITLNKTGGISLEAPMENQILCFGLLEMAKQMIANHNKVANEMAKTPSPILELSPH